MTSAKVWHDWTLIALADPDLAIVEDVPELGVIEEVAIHFAHLFAPDDRVHVFPPADRASADPGATHDHDKGGHPAWHDEVRNAIAVLRSENLVSAGALTITNEGREAAKNLAGPVVVGAPSGQSAASRPDRPRAPGVITPWLKEESVKEKTKKGKSAQDPSDVKIRVMAELNLQYGDGAEAAFVRLSWLWGRVTGADVPFRLTEQYASGRLSMDQVECLVAADAVRLRWQARSLYKVWPDIEVHRHIDRSCITVKADAARRTFNAHGAGIVWAVIDTGIWDGHPHFAGGNNLHDPAVEGLHRSFPLDAEPIPGGAALSDEDGHGTHVAGIIAGGIKPWLDQDSGRIVHMTENRDNPKNPTEPLRASRDVADYSLLAGMAPKALLVSLKAVDGDGDSGSGDSRDRVSRVISALDYVRKTNGDSVEGMRIHGVNLSLGYAFDPRWCACGESPLCKAVDRLVRSGVVVVVAAGNSGYGRLSVEGDAPNEFGFGMTINDPGNAERAITVGSTHRDAPHTYGVSYFSSKGPTGDGRSKPDLVAPGEAIASCAAGRSLAAVIAGDPGPDTAVYVEESGTSMSAPHVSGVAAALLSLNREFIGRPEDVKRIVLDAATPLGRRTDFQGHGLANLLAALQSS
ncbi:S8 family peptidase [Pengzhenrongella sp.]|jgi:subtilisin family serine protease|uniref:S8 family peptidase n=1 Tax=Pengzhenrongella sp. TaxID=2888820 RepID=UPI002F92BCE1